MAPLTKYSLADFWWRSLWGFVDVSYRLFPDFQMKDPRPGVPALPKETYNDRSRAALVSGAVDEANSRFDLDWADFDQLIVWYAQVTDLFGGGSVQVKTKKGDSKNVLVAVMDLARTFSADCQELGHAFGLQHELDAAGGEYGSLYSVMSVRRPDDAEFERPALQGLPEGLILPAGDRYAGSPAQHVAGPQLPAAQLYKLDWFREPRVIHAAVGVGEAPKKVKLYALTYTTQAPEPLPVLAVVEPANGVGRTFAIELRRGGHGYDLGVGVAGGPPAGLVLHSYNPDGRVRYDDVCRPAIGAYWIGGGGALTIDVREIAPDLEYVSFDVFRGTAVARPEAYNFIEEQHNLCRAPNGHIFAMWFNYASGWHREDRTSMVPDTPEALSGPFGYTFLQEQHNLFRCADGHIHALWFNYAQGWHHEDRSAMVPSVPDAVSDPFGYTFKDEQHNLFRAADGHIHALWFSYEQGWRHEDRTAKVPGTPHSLGTPFAYVFNIEQHILFRSADGHIHALWFNYKQGWHHEDRTAMLVGAPRAVGDPSGYVFNNEQHNLFCSLDGHIHAFWFNYGKGWSHEDRTSMFAGVPASVSDPVGYAFNNEQHNLFRSEDGHIHALWFNYEEGWHHEDRTAMVPGTPPALSGPFGYTFNGEQHNLFVCVDGLVHALWFNYDQGWQHEIRG